MKKRLKIISIVSISIVVLCTMLAIIDYNRIVKGKTPLFMTRGMSVEAFDVCIENECNDNRSEQKAQQYKGLGYQIVVCDNVDASTSLNNISCKKEVNFASFKFF